MFVIYSTSETLGEFLALVCVTVCMGEREVCEEVTWTCQVTERGETRSLTDTFARLGLSKDEVKIVRDDSG